MSAAFSAQVVSTSQCKHLGFNLPGMMSQRKPPSTKRSQQTKVGYGRKSMRPFLKGCPIPARDP